VPTTAHHYASEPERALKTGMNRMRAALCDLVEAIGLDETQERALVQTIKRMSYTTEENVADAIRDALRSRNGHGQA